MNVALLHYHLKPGGVTSVIQRQAACLAERGAGRRVVVLSGQQPETPWTVPVHVVPGLRYESDTGTVLSGSTALAEAILVALDEAFPAGCDVLHVHNPLIRKNPDLLGALRILRGRGIALLLQAHDFAEDFRPDVFDPGAEYPEDCDYATVNGRDRDALVAAGVSPGHVHYLPNAIAGALFLPRRGWATERNRGRTTALYPVRAIRRKNLGETVLLSLWLPEGARIAVTLPPSSPREMPAYEFWKRTCGEAALGVRFDAGMRFGLEDLYDGAFCALTTSLKEGFGFTFLDPLVRGIPVVGREVVHAVGDFRAAGIRFPGLYRSLVVPAGMLPAERLETVKSKAIEALRSAFAPLAGTGAGVFYDIARRYESPILDFGLLDEELQAGVVRLVRADQAVRTRIEECNPFLGELFTAPRSEDLAASNRQAVLDAYSVDRYAERLERAYRTVVATGERGHVDRRLLLGRLLVAEAFSAIA